MNKSNFFLKNFLTFNFILTKFQILFKAVFKAFLWIFLRSSNQQISIFERGSKSTRVAVAAVWAVSICVAVLVIVESLSALEVAWATAELLMRRLAAVTNIELASTREEREAANDDDPLNKEDIEEDEEVDEGVGVVVLLCADRDDIEGKTGAGSADRDDIEGIAGAGSGITWSLDLDHHLIQFKSFKDAWWF